MDITGVMPEPAVRKSTFAGGGSGRVKAPCGAASLTTVPGSRPLTRCPDRKPSGMALTVMEMRPSPCSGVEVRE